MKTVKTKMKMAPTIDRAIRMETNAKSRPTVATGKTILATTAMVATTEDLAMATGILNFMLY